MTTDALGSCGRRCPKTRRSYYVTVTIYQPDGDVPLQDFDSPRFRGLGRA